VITYIFRRRLPTFFSIEKLFDALSAHIEKTGLPVRRVELPHVSTGIFSVLRNVWFVARLGKKSVLHVTGDVHYAGLLCPFAKTIITIHDCVVLQRGSGFKRFVLWVLWFWLPLRLAAVITVISEQTKSEVLKSVFIPGKKIIVIPNFVDPAFAFRLPPLARQRPRLLHVGTTPNKNLVRVVASLRGIPCVLVIIGPLSPAEVVDLETSDIAYENFIGLDHNQLRDQYWDADIISFPSTYEGFGMPILEGQASGRPVLTSDLEPMRSVAGEGGALLVNPESIDSIREGFLRLLGDDLLRARLVSVGLENCRRFTLEAVAARYTAVYREIGVC